MSASAGASIQSQSRGKARTRCTGIPSSTSGTGGLPLRRLSASPIPGETRSLQPGLRCSARGTRYLMDEFGFAIGAEPCSRQSGLAGALGRQNTVSRGPTLSSRDLVDRDSEAGWEVRDRLVLVARRDLLKGWRSRLTYPQLASPAAYTYSPIQLPSGSECHPRSLTGRNDPRRWDEVNASYCPLAFAV
jgi:hypothetical protein